MSVTYIYIINVVKRRVGMMGWIEHKEGAQPVEELELVDVRLDKPGFDNSIEWLGELAMNLYWGAGTDITHYRMHEG